MRKAFTLAEVLITLSIIGVVAAMTLPTLIQKQERKEYSVRLKKFYSMMSQAILLAENEFGEIENWSRRGNLTDNDEDTAAIKNYEETRDYWNKYFAPHIKTLKIERIVEAGNRAQNTKIHLADGSTIMAWNGGCFSFSIDVNGDKKPNTLGIDRFPFHICEYKAVRDVYLGNNRVFGPDGMIDAVDRDAAMDYCKSRKYCSALLIMYDDYEFKEDYPW